MPNIQADFFFYFLLLAILIIWLFTRIQRTRQQQKLWKEFTTNKEKYEVIMASAINQTKLLDEEFLDAEGGRRIIKALYQLPMVDAVRSTIVFLGGFVAKVEKNPEILNDREMIRENIVIPLAKQFIFLFAVIDKDIREFVEQEIEKADRAGMELETIIIPLLTSIIEKFSQKIENIQSH